MAFAVKSRNYRRTTPRKLTPTRWVYPLASRFDSSAAAGIAAVIAAGGTLTGAQQTACDTFIRGLKTNSLWSGFYGLYLLVGGTAGSHAVNWKNPGTYNITWVNSPTHNANGVTGNGTSNYGYTTGLHGSTVPFTCGISAYVRTTVSSTTATTKRYIGSGGPSGFHVIDYDDRTGIEANRGCCGSGGSYASETTTTQRTGLLSVNRTSSTNFKGYNNGTQYLTSAVSTTFAPYTNPFGILTFNDNGSYTAFSAENISFAAIHDGHSAAQAAIFNTLVQALQTAFARNV